MIRTHSTTIRSSGRNVLRGFTLVELAIVMGIAGILLAGLWRIVAASNGQMRDQAAASQQTQVIAAIGQFLQSTQGQAYMAATNANTAGVINLPTSSTNCTGTTAGGVNAQAICNFLPPGFSSATVNSYGQTFAAQFLKDGSAAGTAPQSYTYMVLTLNGETIPDTSGGRISGFIGSDGGFLYSNNVCGTPVNTTACGAYGAWSNTLGTYGFSVAQQAASGSGRIASRTFYSPLTGVSNYWLARSQYPGDSAGLGWVYNTMTTDLYMGKNGATATNINMAPSGTTVGGGTIFAYGGGINMGGGTITLGSGVLGGAITGSGTTNISLSSDATTVSTLLNITGSPATTANTPLFNITNAAQCVMTTPGFTAASVACPYAAGFNTLTASNLINTNSLYANTFIYSTSDRRMKDNIATLSNALDHIMQMNPVSFVFKSNGKKSLGVIAQEIEQVYPELVTSQGDGMKAVNYEGIIAPLIGSVQELKKQNDELKAQLEAQKKRQDVLEGQLKKATAKD